MQVLPPAKAVDAASLNAVNASATTAPSAFAEAVTAWLSRTVSEPLLRLAVDAQDITRPLRWNANLREAEVLNQAFAEYADAIRKLASDVREEHRRLAAVLNRLEEGIVLLSSGGLVLAANPAARKLLPSENAEVGWEQRRFAGVISHAGLRAFVADLANPLRPPLYQIDRGPDSTFDLLCHLRILGSGTGEYLLTVINITEFRN